MSIAALVLLNGLQVVCARQMQCFCARAPTEAPEVPEVPEAPEVPEVHEVPEAPFCVRAPTNAVGQNLWSEFVVLAFEQNLWSSPSSRICGPRR